MRVQTLYYWNSKSLWHLKSEPNASMSSTRYLKAPQLTLVYKSLISMRIQSISRYTIAPFLEPLDIFIETLEADGRISTSR